LVSAFESFINYARDWDELNYKDIPNQIKSFVVEHTFAEEFFKGE
jgi:hypothetical protein